jgi:hypothetical protein
MPSIETTSTADPVTTSTRDDRPVIRSTNSFRTRMRSL